MYYFLEIVPLEVQGDLQLLRILSPQDYLLVQEVEAAVEALFMAHLQQVDLEGRVSWGRLCRDSAGEVAVEGEGFPSVLEVRVLRRAL